MNWLQIIIPILAAFGGYFLKHYLDLKKETEKRRLEDKLRNDNLKLTPCDNRKLTPLSS